MEIERVNTRKTNSTFFIHERYLNLKLNFHENYGCHYEKNQY